MPVFAGTNFDKPGIRCFPDGLAGDPVNDNGAIEILSKQYITATA